MTRSRYGFVATRLLSMIPLMLGVLFAVMLLLELVPGDTARVVVGARASDEEVAQVRDELGLDDPIWVRYVDYVAGALHGDLGRSFKTGLDVVDQIAAQLPITLAVALAGVLLALLLTIPLAVLASRRPDGIVDHSVRLLGTLGIGLPSFWLAIMMIVLIALPTGWFPIAGIGDTPAEFLRSLVLPALVVALSIAAPMVRALRATMIELQDAEFVRAAETFGFRGRSLVTGFQLRNAVPPLVTVTAAQAGYALFGTVLVEVAFSLPGMGQGLTIAAGTRDFPLLQGYTLVFAVIVVLLYLLADLVTAIIDPRVRIAS